MRARNASTKADLASIIILFNLNEKPLSYFTHSLIRLFTDGNRIYQVDYRCDGGPLRPA